MIRRFSVSLLLSLCTPILLAQGDRGSIAGLVSDPSGSVIPGATIQAVNQATNLKADTVTTATGIYRLVALPVGRYTLTATVPGFQTYVRQDIQVQVNQTTTIDIGLRVGQVAETVTVSGGAPLIQSESADVGLVVESKRFLHLPLTLGGGIRNPSSFIKLSPGVDPRSTWNKSISGGGSFTDMTYYDGIALSRGDLSNDAEVNPSVDAVEEFKLVTNNYSAEYAHALGAITSFTMKSGTNLLCQIPLGQGHKLLPDGAAGKIFGGWQLALVNAYNSGSRLAATVPNTLLFFNGALRPDLVSGNIRRHVSMSDFDPARHLYLNRSAFALPAEGKFGSAPRYLEVRGPARLDESFAVAKNTRIREGVTHQFRMEILNPLNRVVFGAPVTDITQVNFGSISSTQITPRQIQFGMNLIF